MIYKSLLNCDNIYYEILDKCRNNETIAYSQKSNYITIFYEYNEKIQQNYMNNYPIKLDTKKIKDTLHNNINLIHNVNNTEEKVKYIIFFLDNKNYSFFEKLKSDIIHREPNLINIDNYKIFYSLQKSIINPHYDLVDRFMIQIKGQKKIYLLPPDCIKYFKEYPLLHPANRNFQIKSIFDNTNIHNQVQEFILNEGDGLYIPKYWIHQIETNDLSMSLVITYNVVNNENLYDKDIKLSNITKNIDYYLYNIDGMNTVFKWNKSWFYNHKPPSDMLNIYDEFINMIPQNDIPDKIEIDNIFYNHSLSYEIFFEYNENDIRIPRYF